MANSIPRPATALFGQSRALSEVRSRLDRHRLVTLTGIGGAGKTRLALRVVETCVPDVADDVAWVDLALLEDPGLVQSTICSALGPWGYDPPRSFLHSRRWPIVWGPHDPVR